MKKEIFATLSIAAFLLGPVALADETGEAQEPKEIEAKTEATVTFQTNDGEVDPEKPVIVDPTDPEKPVIVDPGGSDGEIGNGNNSFNIAWASNFRFNDTDSEGNPVGIILNANGMNLWAKGTKLSFMDDAQSNVENIPNFIQVVDNRGKLTGWHLNVSNTTFKGKVKESNEDVELKGAVLSLNQPEVTGPTGVTAPTAFATSLAINNESASVMTAAEKAGTGSWSLSFGDKDEDQKLIEGTGIKLAIPASAGIRSDVTYSSELTWTLADTPNK